ncbi:copper ion binding protein [Bellilinea caldifistulae]|uniref:Heavy metal transporter n=1 Tax=Bellilinea caldifistulae TaxID=360411 RepID=A0A0P6WUG0_9CHLR|nr:heavy metal-associated domain-containing protein [Bellilinea caldifistulae]KPL73892.1 heavy metal transporter [Bellilinea caldifistulae]GAP11181.1 copper ion binding protein [Bellilinea caldifistulae]
MNTITYSVPSMHCHHCVHTIEMEVGELEGVQSVQADLNSKQVVVTFVPPASPEKIETLLAEINYPVQK